MQTQTVIQSAGTGAIMAGLSSFSSGVPISALAPVFVESMGVDLISGELANVVVPFVLPSISPQSMYVKPVVSGLAYSLLDMYSGLDGRNFLSKFLYQTGASGASSYFAKGY